MFKFKNKDTRTTWHRSGVFIVNFEQVSIVKFKHVTAGWDNVKYINPFQVNVPFLYSLKTLENRRFSDVFREYRYRTLVLSWLI